MILTFTCGPIKTNCYLLMLREGVVIDAPPGSYERVTEKADELGTKIRWLINTHGHWDHVQDNRLYARDGVKTAIHESDAGMLTDTRLDYLMKDGETRKFGPVELEIIHTPGHTSGSVCLYYKEKGVLFSGDTLFAGRHGRIDFAESVPDQMKPSLKKLLKLPDNTRVLSGHGPETTLADEAWIRDF